MRCRTGGALRLETGDDPTSPGIKGLLVRSFSVEPILSSSVDRWKNYHGNSPPRQHRGNTDFEDGPSTDSRFEFAPALSACLKNTPTLRKLRFGFPTLGGPHVVPHKGA